MGEAPNGISPAARRGASDKQDAAQSEQSAVAAAAQAANGSGEVTVRFEMDTNVFETDFAIESS